MKYSNFLIIENIVKALKFKTLFLLRSKMFIFTQKDTLKLLSKNFFFVKTIRGSVDSEFMKIYHKQDKRRGKECFFRKGLNQL